MTDGPQGDGWWQASDHKWYPPDKRPNYGTALPPPPAADAVQPQLADSALVATPISDEPQKSARSTQVIQRDKLGTLSKIGQGGQGIVYRAPNVKTKFAASMVFKEYKPQPRAELDFTALAAMPALVEESLTYNQAERLISFAAWPCAIVDDAVTPTGYVMPAIPDKFFFPITTVKGVSTAAAELQHLLNHASVLAARGIEIDDAQRYSLLQEFASALAFLHKHGVCVGDISPKNLLFCLTPREAVYFIDCDAMRINGVSALRQVETPGWNVPSGEELATIYSDAYKLGLLALRLLTGSQDTTNPQHLPATTPSLLRQIITDTLTNAPHQRPLPDAWTYVLGNAIEHAQHHRKTASAAAVPVNVAADSPPVPVVHSRPPSSTNFSRSPVPAAYSRPPSSPWPPEPSSSPTAGGIGRRPKLVLIAGAVVLVAVIAVAVGIHATVKHPSSGPSLTSSPSLTSPPRPTYGEQIVLPFTFTGDDGPRDVAVDSAGALYVTDDHRVLKLAAGSSTPTILPFDGLTHPEGVAVDSTGNVYVSNCTGPVLEYAPGSSTPTVLPFTDVNSCFVAVDSAGSVYVTDYNIHKGNPVFKLAAGSSTPTQLPFPPLSRENDSTVETSMAVDSAGNVYANSHSGVLMLAAGSATAVQLPFTGLVQPVGVAVDGAGNVYVTDAQYGASRIFKLPAGSSTPTALPFTDVNQPWGMAVDSVGNVYVADYRNKRVLKLPKQ
jgi:DNA-binding beta-propeller fold protein YncE